MLTYLQIFCRFANLYSMPSGTISLLRVWTNSISLNSEKLITELNDPHFTEIGILRILTLDLEIQQHLGSPKLVINIIIWIRDMGCYICEGCCLEWFKKFVIGLRVVGSIKKSLKIYCNNEPAVQYSYNNKKSDVVNHINIKYYAVKEKI
jgi:hypothetical protein